MERRFQKIRVIQIYQQCFYLEELSQIRWSIRKKNTTMEEPMKPKLRLKNIISITVDLITKSRFFRISSNRLSKFKSLPVVYITIYHKESVRMYILVIFFYHLLEIVQIVKSLIEISNFDLSIEKTLEALPVISFISLRYLIFILVMLEKFKKFD